jgi:uncharacterized protein YyaL (SSP411 family)
MLKTLLFLLLAGVLSSLSAASPYAAGNEATLLQQKKISWATDYKSALQLAAQSNKPVMLVISNHNCRFCIDLEQNVFTDPAVIDKLNNDYVPVIAYTDENDDYPRDLWVGGTPATWFLYANGTPIYDPMIGTRTAAKFLDILKAFKEVHDKTYQMAR